MDPKLLRQISTMDRRLRQQEAARTRTIDARTFNIPDDGVTDASAKIQAAFDVFTDYGGGKLRFNEGSYRLTEKLNPPANTVIEGEGTKTRFIADMPDSHPPTTQGVIGILSVNNVTIRGITLSCDTWNVGISIDNAQDILIENVTTEHPITAQPETGFAGVAIYCKAVGETKGIMIRDSYLAHGILVQGQTGRPISDIFILNNRLPPIAENETGELLTEGIKVDGGAIWPGVKDVFIIGNRVWGYTLAQITIEEGVYGLVCNDNILTGFDDPSGEWTDAGFKSLGIRINNGQQNATCFDAIIAGNIITGGWRGIYSVQTDGIARALISDNIVKGTHSYAMSIAARDTQLKDNTCYGGNVYLFGARNDAIGNTIYDGSLLFETVETGDMIGNHIHRGRLSVYRCSDIGILANRTFDYAGTAGITIAGSAQTTARSRNIDVIGNVSVGGRQSYGVSVDGESRNIRIRNNHFDGNLGQASIYANALPSTLLEDQRPIHYANAVPTGGTWEQGALVLRTDADRGESLGWACTTAGTEGTLRPATTGSINNTDDQLTLASSVAYDLGDSVSIVGVTGNKRLIERDVDVWTTDTDADATVAGAAVEREIFGTSVSGSAAVEVNNPNAVQVGDYLTMAGAWTGANQVVEKFDPAGDSLTPSTTATTTLNGAAATVADVTKLLVNDKITIFGVTNHKRILAITRDTGADSGRIMLNEVSDAAVTGAVLAVIVQGDSTNTSAEVIVENIGRIEIGDWLALAGAWAGYLRVIAKTITSEQLGTGTITMNGPATGTVSNIDFVYRASTLLMASAATGSVSSIDIDYSAPVFSVLTAQAGIVSRTTTPVGALTPSHVGQEILDTVAVKFWKASGTGNTDWVALN